MFQRQICWTTRRVGEKYDAIEKEMVAEVAVERMALIWNVNGMARRERRRKIDSECRACRRVPAVQWSALAQDCRSGCGSETVRRLWLRSALPWGDESYGAVRDAEDDC